MIEENQELRIKNLLSFRDTIAQSEMQSTITAIEKFITEKSLKAVGPKITTTYSISQAMTPTMDLEILIPINRSFESTEKYKFKPELKITNALKSVHKENPQEFNNSVMEIQKYIQDNKLMPITSLYTVTINEVKNSNDMDKFHAELFISINPNIC